jgi:hypothetical protein
MATPWMVPYTADLHEEIRLLRQKLLQLRRRERRSQPLSKLMVVRTPCPSGAAERTPTHQPPHCDLSLGATCPIVHLPLALTEKLTGAGGRQVGVMGLVVQQRFPEQVDSVLQQLQRLVARAPPLLQAGSQAAAQHTARVSRLFSHVRGHGMRLLRGGRHNIQTVCSPWTRSLACVGG